MLQCDFIKVALGCKATLLKSHYHMGFLLWFCWVFPEHLFLVRPLESCFCTATFKKQDLFPQQGC